MRNCWEKLQNSWERNTIEDWQNPADCWEQKTELGRQEYAIKIRN